MSLDSSDRVSSRGTGRLAGAAASFAVLVAVAAAQDGGTPLDLRRPVDQGLADRNQLGTSLRSLPTAIDPGRSFGRIYVDPRRPDRFLRRQGGLSAVFPASVYVGEGADGIPIVPPGTVFQLGWNRSVQEPDVNVRSSGSETPTDRVSPERYRLDASTRLVQPDRWSQDGPGDDASASDRSATAGFGDPTAAFESSSSAASRQPPRLVRDEAYRVRRLRELFRRALEEQSRRAGGVGFFNP